MDYPKAEEIREFLAKFFEPKVSSRYFNYWSEANKTYSFTPENCERYKFELKKLITDSGWNELSARERLDDFFIQYLTYHFPMLINSGWKIIIYHPKGSGFKYQKLEGSLGSHDIMGNLIKF